MMNLHYYMRKSNFNKLQWKKANYSILHEWMIFVFWNLKFENFIARKQYSINMFLLLMNLEKKYSIRKGKNLPIFKTKTDYGSSGSSCVREQRREHLLKNWKIRWMFIVGENLRGQIQPVTNWFKKFKLFKNVSLKKLKK